MMSKLWQKLIRPAMFSLEAETAHELGMAALRYGLTPAVGLSDADAAVNSSVFGPIERFGLRFANPLGLAAGFDKNGVAVGALADLGFGFVEVGTVTLRPQPGNPKPRLFRLPADQALINRLGFNNDGAMAVAKRLEGIERRCIIGVNIGKNKDVPIDEATENYVKCLEVVHQIADYIAINISSPNTPNLRKLQNADNLDELIGSLQARNIVLSSAVLSPAALSPAFRRQTREPDTHDDGTQPAKPLLVKIAPDLTDAEIESIVDIAIKHNVAGIIATNTTISREALKTRDVASLGAGGLSGRPLTMRSTRVISTIYKAAKGKLPIIGVGGIFTPEDAFDKIAAGASLLQAYTGFIYGGPRFAVETNNGLAQILKEKGFKSLDEAVGSAHG